MMKNKKQNEELQNRREFFRSAAKKMLPIIGAIALASSPIIAQTSEKNAPMGCEYGCSGGCYLNCSSCVGGCRGTCWATCRNNCMRGGY